MPTSASTPPTLPGMLSNGLAPTIRTHTDRREARRVVGGDDHVVQALDRAAIAGAHGALGLALVGEPRLGGDRQRPELRLHDDVSKRPGARSRQARVVVDADDDGLGLAWRPHRAARH